MYRKKAINIFLTIFASIMLLAGVVLLISPIPIGIPLIAISLSILIYVNETAQSWFRGGREKSDRFNQKIHWIEEKVGTRVQFIGKALVKTRPTNIDFDKFEK